MTINFISDCEKPWGHLSQNVDDEKDDKLIYTRHEESGRVNQYVDNGDGGHGHFSWKDEESYENEEEPEQSRRESNRSENPDEGDVVNRSGCYLTSACIMHYKKEFNDNCYELEVLRWFRENFVSEQDKKEYRIIAPKIVRGINKDDKKDEIYNYIYDAIIDPCIKLIENGNYERAYHRYKQSILSLSNVFVEEDTNINAKKL